MTNRAIPVINRYRCLENAVTDPLVGIRIIRVTGDDAMGLYIAELDPENRITDHFHTHGNEIYCILRGNGRIHTGQPGGKNRSYGRSGNRTGRSERIYPLYPGFQ
jgi:mannose-6-phosphate isomerase-like protein (cupin superfamily)